MKTLTLLRHAKSSWADPTLDDFDRPLNPRGRRDAPEMGRRLKARGDTPDLIISSPARRALATARMVVREIAIPEDRIIEEPALYHASAGKIMSIVRSLESMAEHLMLVGHNPGFNDFANSLTDTQVDNLPTAAVFQVEFDVDDWSAVAAGKGRLVRFDYPKRPFAD
jgi:phosphohistidine phosphatase